MKKETDIITVESAIISFTLLLQGEQSSELFPEEQGTLELYQ